ncbi:MAG TPA: hypothetical protein VEZ19_05930 [Rubrobacter sp.]|jgi:hypothetical protein|nr:hypothetical protein [Rubrobacter sp.]
MLYLEALAAREQQIRETRRRIEHDRLEARSARNRSGTEAAPRLPLPRVGVLGVPAWSVRRWRGAGW